MQTLHTTKLFTNNQLIKDITIYTNKSIMSTVDSRCKEH